MSTNIKLLLNFNKIRHFSSAKRNFTVGKIIYNTPKSPTKNVHSVANVTGLSENVVKVPSEPVGPGATKSSENYKNPEYFCYNKTSYFEAEIEILKYRCPQPSVYEPYQHTNPK